MDFERWSDLVFSRYIGARNAGASNEELSELRNRLWSGADRYRGQFRSRCGRLWAADTCASIFGELVRDDLKSERINLEAFFYNMEATRTRLLLDYIGLDFKEFPTAETKDFAIKLERELLKFNPSSQTDPIYSEMRLASLLSIGNHWDKGDRSPILKKVEDNYLENNAGFEGVASPANLFSVRNALLDDELIIEYYIPYHELHPAKELLIMVITKKQVLPISMPLESILSSGFIGRMAVDGQQPIDASPLGEEVINLRMAIQSPNREDEASRLLRFFYQLLIEPLIEFGIQLYDFRRCIFIPHGFLHYIPFGALLSEHGDYLIEKVGVVTSPSASVWYNLQKPDRSDVSGLLGLGNPDLKYSKLPRLDGAEKEIERISELTKKIHPEILVEKEATEEVFRERVKNKSIVHLATHGEFPESDVIDFHRVLLSKTRNHDGHLNADELRQMDLSSVRLFVLSICNGGLFRFGPGDEPYGLIPALFTAGAENVIGTLWPLEDQIGRYFMSVFYNSLLSDGPAEALRKASIQFIKDGALFSNWAGFVLTGSGRPLD